MPNVFSAVGEDRQGITQVADLHPDRWSSRGRPLASEASSRPESGWVGGGLVGYQARTWSGVIRHATQNCSAVSLGSMPQRR